MCSFPGPSVRDPTFLTNADASSVNLRAPNRCNLTVKRLLEEKIDTELEDGDTVMIAVKNNNEELLRRMLEAGANTEVVNVRTVCTANS